MPDWRSRLEKLVRVGGIHIEPYFDFELSPPSGRSWPEGLPSCPALRDFYALCDGGDLQGMRFHPLTRLQDLAEWRSGAITVPPGRFVVLGDGMCDCPVAWDGCRDLVGWYDVGGSQGEPRFVFLGEGWGDQAPIPNPTMERFLGDLFTHARERGLGEDQWMKWDEALDLLDAIA